MIAFVSQGHEAAFDRLVEPHRRDIHSLCWRMLGSAHDADDASQEAFLRAWRALPRFEGRSSMRTWLRRIATNVCLDELGRRTPVEPYPEEAVGVPDETPGPAARYEQRETLEHAFMAALGPLPPRQRAVFVLRDVLAFPAADTARLLEASPASVNSALQRARGKIGERMPDQGRHMTLEQPDDEGLREVVRHLVTAFEGERTF